MAYYLQMDGVDDFIQLPSMTLNKIVFDGKIRRNASAAKIVWDFRTGIGFTYLLQDTTGKDSTGSGSAKVNGVTVTNNTTFIPDNVRCTIEHTFSTGTDNGNIFSNNGGNGSFVSGDIYDIKIYNGATLVAWYDMTLGNVQDQSGNGRHATLTGGTWVSESSGTTHEGASSVTGVSTITASAALIPAAITGAASLQGVATVSATANVVNAPMVGSASLQGVGTATATASIIRSGSANIIGVSTLTASAAGLSVLGGASLTGVGWVMCSAIEGQFIVSIVNLEFEVLRTVQLESSIERVVNLEALLTRIVALEGEL